MSWSYYVILLTIKDVKKRAEYEKKVLQNNLSKRELAFLVRKERERLQLPDKEKSARLLARRGRPYVYKLKETDEELSRFESIRSIVVRISLRSENLSQDIASGCTIGRSTLLSNTIFNFRKKIKIIYGNLVAVLKKKS